MEKVLFSSKKQDWETPDDLFDKLNEEFHFLLDVCAHTENAKLPHFFSPEQDGLQQRWLPYPCWCNPPYARGEQQKWIAKAAEEQKRGVTTVMLLPARTDTKAFHKYIYQKKNVEIRFLKGRLQFIGAKYKAPFPSMIVVFRGYDE